MASSADGALQVAGESAAPSLDLGELGAFDDCGAMPGSIVWFRGRLLLYYTGWTRGGSVPFHFHIGLAESRDEGRTFQRVSRAPVLGRNIHDPFIAGAPWVVVEGDRLRMWYSSATEWRPPPQEGGVATHFYSIKHAISSNAVDWTTSDRLCLEYEENEHAIARPVVDAEDGDYLMVYSARRLGGRYEIFAAHSHDGLTWQRVAEPLLGVGAADWENLMVCYGCCARIGPSSYLLYNGNDYGRAGFGAIRLAD